MRRILFAIAFALPIGAQAATLDEEVEAAVAAVREASSGDAGARLGHALGAARRILDRVQDLLARRRLAEARALLPEMRVRVRAVQTARRVLDLEERARAKERAAVEADEDARVAKDAYERAIEVRRELEAAP